MYKKCAKITTLQLQKFKLECGNLYTLSMHNLVIMNQTVKEKFENIHFPWRYKSWEYILYKIESQNKGGNTSAICNNSV